VLDTLLGMGGWDVLHPEVRPFFEQHGYDHSDIEEVFRRVGSGAMLPKAWSEVAGAVERKARFYQGEGFDRTAEDMFIRASVLWGRAQYSFYGDDPRRIAFKDRARGCVDALQQLSGGRLERVELEFEGFTLHALLHLPHEIEGQPPFPAVILGPGMDMIKEDMTGLARRYYLPRRMAALAIEGPGQGESLTGGLKVNLTNYDRAISAFVDFLSSRPDIDSARVGMWGVSMGSYWGIRAAAHEPRLGAVATAAGCYGDFDVIFGRAQPNFKANFMYMSGYEDEQAFDAELASQMGLWGLADRVACPVLLGFGEFDELTRIEDTLRLFESLPAPKELLVFEQEFHPLGPVSAELFQYGAEWLQRVLDGELEDGFVTQRYVMRNGEMQTGSAAPAWWSG
jgi:dienelactone hydrolase